MNKEKIYCVQCGSEIDEEYITGFEPEVLPEDSASIQFPVCEKPNCPNYGLLQIGIRKSNDPSTN
jgi:hypothetical protein